MNGDSKHILYLSSWYPNKYRPFLGNFVRRQASMVSKYHTVFVVNTVASDQESDFRTEQSTEGNLHEIFVYHPQGKSIFQKRKYQRKALRKALRGIHHIDLMITQIIFPKALQFIDAKKHFHCPWIHIEHGSYFSAEKRSEWSWKEKYMLRRAEKHLSRLFAVSDFIRNDMKAVFSKDIDLLPNHVDVVLFSFKQKKTSERKRFLHVSTLDPNTKNPKGMFDACKELLHRGIENFEFDVVSDEPTAVWETYCKEIGISEHVNFSGPLPWEALPPHYHQADAFILNSDYETFSIVLAEAWATGTPVITTPVGIGHRLPPFLGLQTTIDTPSSIADAMENVIEGSVVFDGEAISEYGQLFSESNVETAVLSVISSYAR